MSETIVGKWIYQFDQDDWSATGSKWFDSKDDASRAAKADPLRKGRSTCVGRVQQVGFAELDCKPVDGNGFLGLISAPFGNWADDLMEDIAASVSAEELFHLDPTHSFSSIDAETLKTALVEPLRRMLLHKLFCNPLYRVVDVEIVVDGKDCERFSNSKK